MTILLGFVGSTAMDASFAASPVILLPFASTLTCCLVNWSCTETIPGDTPIPHKGRGAGGLSYCSSGSLGSGLGGPVWPEAMATADSKTRQVKKLAFDTLKHFQLNKDI